MEDECVVKCDREIGSQLLLSRLKDHDRTVSKQSFDLFSRIEESFGIFAKRYVRDQTISEIGSDLVYIRCTIVSDKSDIDVTDEAVGFYQCNFIGVETIRGAFVFGENISIGRDLIWKDIHIPFGPFLIQDIRSSELSEKLRSKNVAMELITTFPAPELRRIIRTEIKLGSTMPLELVQLFMDMTFSTIRTRVRAVKKMTGMRLALKLMFMIYT